ncbi:MAG: hypothetical protein ACLR23_08510 [Clostridia bacterium]
MLLRLQQLGYAITKEDIERYSGGEGHVISRLHFAQALTEKDTAAIPMKPLTRLLGQGVLAIFPDSSYRRRKPSA